MLLKFDDEDDGDVIMKNGYHLGILHRLDVYENLIDTDDCGLTVI